MKILVCCICKKILIQRDRSGFTLLEILLVLGIIGILAAIVLIAINPTKQLEDARGADRSSAIRELENAVIQYIIDGESFTGIPSGLGNAVDICRGTITGSACTDAPVNGYDLSVLVPEYVVNIPVDPNETDENLSGYRIYLIGSFVKVCSPVIDEGCGS